MQNNKAIITVVAVIVTTTLFYYSMHDDSVAIVSPPAIPQNGANSTPKLEDKLDKLANELQQSQQEQARLSSMLVNLANRIRTVEFDNRHSTTRFERRLSDDLTMTKQLQILF